MDELYGSATTLLVGPSGSMCKRCGAEKNKYKQRRKDSKGWRNWSRCNVYVGIVEEMCDRGLYPWRVFSYAQKYAGLKAKADDSNRHLVDAVLHGVDERDADGAGGRRADAATGAGLRLLGERPEAESDLRDAGLGQEHAQCGVSALAVVPESGGEVPGDLGVDVQVGSNDSVDVEDHRRCAVA